MELSSQEASCVSDLEDPVWWVASASPDHPRDDMGPSWNAAAGPPTDKIALEDWPDESWDPNMKFCSLEISASTKPSADSFLEKLREILSGQSFESIWWGNDGNCVVIGEKLFRKEVLGRKGPRKIFETESMRGFLLQLMFHGFRRLERDSPLLTSMEELRAVAAAGSALGKLLFYSNPFFTRDDHPCVQRGAQGAGESTNPLAASRPGTGIQAKLPRKRRDAQPGAGAEEEDEDTETSTSSSSTVPEPWARTAPEPWARTEPELWASTAPEPWAHMAPEPWARTEPELWTRTEPEPWARTEPWPGSAGPSPHKRRCRHSPAGTQEMAPAPAPATAPLPHAAPRAPRRPLTLAGLPMLRPRQPHRGAAQVPGAVLALPRAPWFGMAVLRPGPGPGHAPAHGHCPTCTCTNTAGPRPEPDWEEQGP